MLSLFSTARRKIFVEGPLYVKRHLRAIGNAILGASALATRLSPLPLLSTAATTIAAARGVVASRRAKNR